MAAKYPSSIKITEVGPRDGLQNEFQVISPKDKIKFIKSLIKAGLENIEVTSFVKKEKIPQLSDAKDVFSGVFEYTSQKGLNIQLPCLVPNRKGAIKALEEGVKEFAFFTATSETFCQKNINASIEKSFDRLRKIKEEIGGQDIKLRGYLSTVFGCPYEGEQSTDKVLELIGKLFDLGIYEVSLGDTIGVGTPEKVRELISSVKSQFGLDQIALHFHDTRGMAIANILVSLELGVKSFDSSAGGLGGCPYAAGASGNVATEDLVYLCESLGVKTGVDMKRLTEASQFILQKLGKSSTSKYYSAFINSGY